MMKNRRHLTQDQKEDILKRQGNLCNLPACRRPLVSGLYEWDHIQDLQFDGDNELDNWQAICTKPCHKDKTKRAAGAMSRANQVRLGKTRKWRPMRKDPRDTIEFRVSFSAHAVSLAVNDMVNLAKMYPHLVRQELAALANANDDLACLVAKLTVVREAAE